MTTKSAASLFSGLGRFEVKKGNRGSRRGEMLDKFLDRLNAARVGTKYKPLSIKRVAMMLAHVPTDDLYPFYKDCERAKTFSAYFHWALKPENAYAKSPEQDGRD